MPPTGYCSTCSQTSLLTLKDSLRSIGTYDEGGEQEREGRIPGSHCSFRVFSSHREDVKGGGFADDTPPFRELSDPPDRVQVHSIKRTTHEMGLLFCQKTVLLNTPDAG